MRVVSLLIVVTSAAFLTGCPCTTSCKYRQTLPENHQELVEASETVSEAAVARNTRGTVLTKVDNDGDLRNLSFDPTVGIILGEIRVLLDDLATSARDLTQEMRAIVGDIEGSSSQLIEEIDDTLGNRLEDTFDQLNETEKRLMTDAQATIFALERSVQAIREGSAESIKTSLWEASIVAWDAEYSLPCVERVPRLVYPTPSVFRIWPDQSKPGDPEFSDPDDRRSLVVKLRGNFLAFAEPIVTVGGIATEVKSYNDNEVVVRIPDEIVAQMREAKFAREIPISATVANCKGDGGTRQISTNVTIKPPLRYSVSVRHEPVAKLPKFSTEVQRWYDKPQDCNAKRSYTNQHTIGPPAVVRDYSIRVYNKNGNSYIQSSRALKYKVEVKAKINGKGKDCFLGICNCRGRGWLGYEVRIDLADYIEDKLRVSESTSEDQQLSYQFPYLYDIPSDKQDLKCFFYARVVVDDAGQEKVIELDFENRIVEGVQANVNLTTCDINITVPPGMAVMGRR